MAEEHEELKPVIEELVSQCEGLIAEMGSVHYQPPQDKSSTEGCKREWDKYLAYLNEVIVSETAIETVIRNFERYASFANSLWHDAWREADDGKKKQLVSAGLHATITSLDPTVLHDRWGFLIESVLCIETLWTRADCAQKLFEVASEVNEQLTARGNDVYAQFISVPDGQEVANIPAIEYYGDDEQPTQPILMELWANGDMKTTASGMFGVLGVLQKVGEATKYVSETGEQTNLLDAEIVTPFDAEMHLDKTVNVMVIFHAARMANVAFHKTMKGILAPILSNYKDSKDGISGFYRGELKNYARMSDKVEEYMDKAYPRAAYILDPVRATIAVDTRPQRKASDEIELIRSKNKFNEEVQTPFRNIMINIKIKSHGIPVVGEIQITTLDYLKLKKLQHKIYKIMRAFGEDGKREPREVFNTLLKTVCNS